MATDQDRALLLSLTRLNAAITTFSMDLSTTPDRQAHVELALMLLNAADQVLQRLVDGCPPETGGQ